VKSNKFYLFSTNILKLLCKPLCSRLRPDVRDRQTDVRQTSHRQTSDSIVA